MIIFSSKAFDLIGVVVIKEDARGTQMDNSSRRVSRTATLDGGVVPTDGGFAEGDREITVKTKTMTREEFLRMQRMESLYGVQSCATHQGVFEGSIAYLKIVKGMVAIKFLVHEKVSV